MGCRFGTCGCQEYGGLTGGKAARVVAGARMIGIRANLTEVTQRLTEIGSSMTALPFRLIGIGASLTVVPFRLRRMTASLTAVFASLTGLITRMTRVAGRRDRSHPLTDGVILRMIEAPLPMTAVLLDLAAVLQSRSEVILAREAVL